jgi:arylsulfatase A-like enzyme
MDATNANVVLVVMDTARAREVFSPDVDTPVLDELADDGVACEQAYADAPWTLPSHASLFTGCSPSKHGAHAGHKFLDDGSKTIAETLNDDGYATVSITNNAWVTQEFGFTRGFDRALRVWQFLQNGADFGEVAMKTDGTEQLRESLRLLFQNPLRNAVNAVYGKFFYRRGDYGAGRTNQLIERELSEISRPYFLFVNYLEPHLDYQPPEEYARQYLPAGVSYEEARSVPQEPWEYLCGQVDLGEREFEILRALYSAEISYLDDRIGEVVEHLKSTGDWEETIFVVLGDHGENIGDHGFMDHQYCLYDTLLHVPLILSGGAVEAEPPRRDIVQISDVYPTILDLLDLSDTEAREQFQGQSIFAETRRTAAVSEYMAAQPSMESLESEVGDVPEHVYRLDRRLRSIRTAEYKLIRSEHGEVELYDVRDDPGELTDRSSDDAETVTELETELDEWLAGFEQTSPMEDEREVSDEMKSRLEDLGYI